MTSNAEAAELLGVPVSEVLDVMDSPAGDVITTSDGNSYIVVPDDRPDSANQVGLMFVTAPHEGYVGPYKVYAGPTIDGETLAETVEDHLEEDRALKIPTKAALTAIADDLGVEIRPSWSAAKIHAALIKDAEELARPLIDQALAPTLIPPANDANALKPEAAPTKVELVDATDAEASADKRDGDGEGHPTDAADKAAEAAVGAGSDAAGS